ncbi:MAG: hypothetical protein IJV27_06000 [Prevotella sp.]|nr:hypothetical protein [Prevotella sp.]
MKKRYFAILLNLMLATTIVVAQSVCISVSKDATARERYAQEYLLKKLTKLGYQPVYASDGKMRKADYQISLAVSDEAELHDKKESYCIIPKKKRISILGSDGSGVIYGCSELADYAIRNGSLNLKETISESPGMVLRGTCVGLQKTVYLPGHAVYEYPYTPENFPWFYKKEQWTEYLDMLVDNKMNSLYLWNGHPFASLVKLKDYPFALEVDEETFRKNEKIFSFLTQEADRRGIFVIQMFYNIILSKPFADHYGLKTQDRHRPITPLISDYTRKSIAAFIEKYPNVGLLVCLGEAMATIEDDVLWMKETIIPGIKDGLTASGRTDIPPVVLRSHDTDGPLVLRESLPLYPNIYTMSKYTGESLTTYEPGGPWGETHRQLANAAPVHIDNVHILANLEPWRWSSPSFTQKTVQAMHRVHHSKGLHLYPQASYWDWPYTADKLANGSRLKQLDRDWMWYKAWGRYAWDCERGDDSDYWLSVLMDYYGIKERHAAQLVLDAYNESGEIAPKLLRRFGITEGNRQTLLLGMKMSQLVNPYKYTIYPGFYESCGPQGEKLIEYVEKEWKGEKHEGEQPLDIVEQCLEHGEKAVRDVKDAVLCVGKHKEEFSRFAEDMRCYKLFAQSFHDKVLAAQQVLNYKWTKDIKYLEAAVPFLEQSLHSWRELSHLTDLTYLYANSMQTAQRRIPVGGDNGNFKTWSEMLPVYEEELSALKTNIEKLKNPSVAVSTEKINAAKPASVKLISPVQTVKLTKGAFLYENRPEMIDSVAPELEGLNAIVLNRDTTRIKGTTIEFDAQQPVKMLVGFYNDDDPKWANPPKLEVDATGNEYGQAEPVISNAVNMTGMPLVNIHAYQLPAGRHTLRLPKGIIMVAGFTSSEIKPRDAGLNGAGDEVDWLFY